MFFMWLYLLLKILKSIKFGGIMKEEIKKEIIDIIINIDNFKLLKKIKFMLIGIVGIKIKS